MDCRTRLKRDANPIATASWLSKATFFFTFPLFRKGEIQDSDVYETLEHFTSTSLGNELEQKWMNEKSKKNPWFFRALWKQFGKEIVLLGILVLVIECVTIILKPMLVGKIVKVFEPIENEITIQDGFYYSGALLLSLIVFAIAQRYYSRKMAELLLKIKLAVSSLIYRKLIKTAPNQYLHAQVVTLITKDLTSCNVLMDCTYRFVLGIFQIIILDYMIFNQVGISAIFGILWLLVYGPLQGIVGCCLVKFRLRTASLTDKRLRIMQETLTAARTIKMYTWENFHTQLLETARLKEMSNIRSFCIVQSLAFDSGSVCLKLIFCTIVLTYIGYGNKLTAEKAFMITTCIQQLSSTIDIFIPSFSWQFSNMQAALKRLNDFLNSQEVCCLKREEHILQEPPMLIVNNLSLTFSNFKILDNVNLFTNAGLTIIKGSTGTGKSTLLQALFGEVPCTTGSIAISGTISYACQEPWLFPGTIRQNILFGEPYDSKRYRSVIRACALEKDLDTFLTGDSTYLSDRGLNLSKGQKARINLARCVYKKSDIYLLDDCLSTLDISVANQIFYTCIKGLLGNRVCILITHNEMYFKEANQVYCLNTGRLTVNSIEGNIGQYTQFPDDNFEELRNGDDESEINEQTKLLDAIPDKTEVYEEHNEQGGVDKKVYYFYISSGRVWVFAILVVLIALSRGTNNLSQYFLSAWVNAQVSFNKQKENNNNQYNDESIQLQIKYFAVIVAHIVLAVICSIGYYIFTYMASIKIHRTVLPKVIGATMYFYDKNLSGNILNRFSRDLGIIDEQIANTSLHFMSTFWLIIITLGVVSSVQYYLFFPSAVLLLILYTARRFYLPTSLSIRRLEGSTRSPVIGHINASAEGLATIRAHGMQKILITEFENHLDLYGSAMFMNIATQCAFAFTLDILCAVYIGIVTFAMLGLKDGLLSGEVGLAITQSLGLSGFLLQFCISQWAELENCMTSLERVMAFTKIKSENQTGESLPKWPSRGKLTFDDVSLKYKSSDGPILRGINFQVNSKEKIGIVGRTGAGKTSLVSALFRLYNFEGSISIDGINITQIHLQNLRSKISIIPQDPYLFTGSIRDNLDPYREYSDTQLWETLDQVELKSLIPNLDEIVGEDGINFSAGQKQLVCLARAILRRNVLLVLDEATSNLDCSADVLIKKTIRNCFSDCTVITIAHRISTIIDCDKILVMDQGKVIEYGRPDRLLNSCGSFYNMAKSSGLIENT